MFMLLYIATQENIRGEMNMERINLQYINLRKLKKINSMQCLESDLFHNNTIVYKIYKNMPLSDMTTKERKIELLDDGAKLPNVVMPIDKLLYSDDFFGYTMKYINDSIPLFDFNINNKNINVLFNILNKISKSLTKIHSDPRNIIVSDLHFDNILIDRNYNPYFIDFDSCQIDGIDADTIPMMLHSYLQNRKIQTVDISQNSDKLCLLLCTLGMLFGKHIDEVKEYEIDKKTEQIKNLKDTKELILEIKNSKTMPTVPYLHELIPFSNNKKVKRI